MRKKMIAGVIGSVVLLGCQHAKPPPPAAPATQPATRPADRLVGTWIADHLDPKTGDLQLKLVFTKRPKERLLAWSELPLRGRAITSEAPFTATDEAIESTAFPDGRPANYRFDEKGHLLIRRSDGSTVTFHRAK